jgi:hypothetical protein
VKPLLLFIALAFSLSLQAQTEIPTDTATYELTLLNGHATYVRILEIKQGQYIKVVDDEQKQYTYSWDAFRGYKPAYHQPVKKEEVHERVSPNYNNTGYIPKLPGQRQRNVGIALFSIGVAILAAAIPMVATARTYHYNYVVSSNGQSYSEGDLKGALGVVLLVPGTGLSITGAALWDKGSRKMKRFRQSQQKIAG